MAAPAAQAAPKRVSSRVLLGQLGVAAEHPAGYRRALFPGWIDADHDGCNTRNEVLVAEAARKPEVGSGCRLTGGRWVSPYDDATVTNASKLDIDHLVPLAEAYQSGAWRWSAKTRAAYANDLGYAADLVAVSAHANRSKGEREPSAYLPPRAAFRCRYVADWVAVKWRWHLTVDRAEKRWLTAYLATCAWPRITQPTRPKITAATTKPPTGGSKIVTFANCTAMHMVYPHGVGRPGAVDHTSGRPVTDFFVSKALYQANTKSDGDKDGIACEA